HPYFRLYLIGVLDARLGDATGAQRAATDLEQTPAGDARSLAVAFAHAIRARLASQQNRWSDALAELSQVPVDRAAADLLGVVPLFDMLQERFLRGETLRALNRDAEAPPWYGAVRQH